MHKLLCGPNDIFNLLTYRKYQTVKLYDIGKYVKALSNIVKCISATLEAESYNHMIQTPSNRNRFITPFLITPLQDSSFTSSINTSLICFMCFLNY